MTFSRPLCELVGAILSPTHLLSFSQNQVPQLLPVLWTAENWVCTVKAEDMVSKFPFPVVLTRVSGAWFSKRRTLSFLASSHLLLPSLAFACTEKLSLKKYLLQ